MNISNDEKIAMNSLYGQKSTVDRCFEAAISEKLDLSKPEDVVRALFHAYLYMYNQADNDDAEAALRKYCELTAAYDMCTGKPKNKSDDKKSNETYTEYRLDQLEKAVGKALMRIDDIWLAIEGIQDQESRTSNELDMTNLRVKRLESSTPEVSFGFGCSDLPKTEE